ncbi:MAG: hypothetical protein ACI3ZJ_03165 [Bacteroidaceae bacterium]
MKIKSLLSFFVPAAMMSLAVAGCSDYDNGYSEQAIKFAQDFRKTFGDIDPEQDWNLAERGTVTVSTMKESEVKIYAKMGDEYAIVGDYEGVKGTRMLGFDMVEGTKEIVVTDGATAQKTVPGGVVTFGGTRAIFTDPDDSNGDGVKVSKIPAGGTTIKEVTYPQYKYISSSDYDAVRGVVPEIGSRQDHTNLNRVTHDFSYISNGEFVIYPYFWNTSSDNTIGVYYTDANGQYHEVDIYQNKGEGLEGQGEEYLDANLSEATLVGQNVLEGRVSKRYYSNSTNIQAAYWQDYKALVHGPLSGIYLDNLGFPTDISDYTKLVVNADLKNGTDNFRVGIYEQSADGKDIQETRIVKTITTSGEDVVIDLNGSEFANFNKHNCKIYLFGSDAANHNNSSGVTIQGIQGCQGDIQFNKVQLVKNGTSWSQYNGGNANDIVQNNRQGRSQGIVVNIPEGTKFGMYLKKTDGAVGDCTFYSESSKNTDTYKHGHGIIDYGNGTVNWDDTNSKPSYASTFTIGDQMFIGFEDWPNNTDSYGGGDFDLNDIVLAFAGSKPTIINEDPKATVWLVACEDLGGSFDIDYNDVVFSVEHVSGKPKAKLTPLAAGGTLASYIYFQDPWDSERDKCFGEIHQLFGATKVNSGEFSIINAKSRYEKTAAPIEFEVDEDWTMAYYATGDGSGSAYTRNGKDVNMGGFEVRTLKSGSDAPSTLPINSGAFSGASKIQPSVRNEGENVPYILCIPYSYTRYNYPEAGKKADYVWAWPVEYMTICDEAGKGPYPDFRGWVQDHTQNTDWYKNKNNAQSSATVEDLILSTGDMTQEEINANGGGNAQQFGHSNEVVNVNRAISLEALKAAMKANLTGTSSSDIKYYYKDDNGNWTEITGPFWVARERDVKAEQDGNSTEFKLNILKDQLGNKGSITITKGETVNLVNNLTGYQGNGTFTLGYNGNSLDFGSKGWDPTNFKPTSTGKHTVTVTQTGDNDHEAGSTTFDLIVKEANGGGQTFNVPGTISSAVFTIENGSNGKYNVKYNGNTILTNVASVKFSWSDISGNSMQIFTPWNSSSVRYVATNNQAGSKSYTISDNLWSTGESHEISLNPYGGSFTLTISGE